MSRFRPKPVVIRSRQRAYMPQQHRPYSTDSSPPPAPSSPTRLLRSIASLVTSVASLKQEPILPGFRPPSPPRSLRLPRLSNSPAVWLLAYFLSNLGLTLYNKSVLGYFPFPYTLSALHALAGSLGTAALARSGAFMPVVLTWRQTNTLVAFSMLYSVNILVSNVSLKMVTVPVSAPTLVLQLSPRR